jgi:methionyl-tRNA synthetase
MSWGIELPFDKDYVTYVWFDALLNYVTGPGYGVDDERFNYWWPADLHLIGKDILTTHSVYWTTMLFSLGLPLPKTILAHGWWLIGETKMSKSLGNIVNPLDLVEQYGVDAVRYYLMREMVLGQDSNFTIEGFIKRYNSDLANDFGNLLNRVSGLIGKYFGGRVPEPAGGTEAEAAVAQTAGQLQDRIAGLVTRLKIHDAIEEVLLLVRQVNKYLEAAAPWKLAKTDLARAGTVLYTATEALRVSAFWLKPVMPAKAGQVLGILDAEGAGPDWGGLRPGTPLKTHDALFPRIEVTE